MIIATLKLIIIIIIKGKALCKPETTEELNEMVKYIEHTKEEGVIKLEARIRELRRHMAYLLDTHLFEKEDIDLNTEVMMWPTNINPIFDQNEELTNETRQAYESLLNHQREKLLIELDKLHKRIDEFSDYGELDQMKQYVDDTKNVAKRINDANR
jgi:dynein heavy chain